MNIVFDAKLLAERRASKGLTQEAVARKAGLSNACIVSIENGHKEPKASTLAKIARVLTTRMESFFKCSA